MFISDTHNNHLKLLMYLKMCLEKIEKHSFIYLFAFIIHSLYLNSRHCRGREKERRRRGKKKRNRKVEQKEKGKGAPTHSKDICQDIHKS